MPHRGPPYCGNLRAQLIFPSQHPFSKLPGGKSAKGPPAYAGKLRGAGSIPGLGRSPGGEHGNPLQYSHLENPMERGALRATVHRAT